MNVFDNISMDKTWKGSLKNIFPSRRNNSCDGNNRNVQLCLLLEIFAGIRDPSVLLRFLDYIYSMFKDI